MNYYKPLLEDGKCISCNEAYSRYSIKKRERCTYAKHYRNGYIASISLIAISFVGVSVVKLLAFCGQGESAIHSCACGCTVMILIILCVFAIGGVFTLVLFAGPAT